MGSCDVKAPPGCQSNATANRMVRTAFKGRYDNDRYCRQCGTGFHFLLNPRKTNGGCGQCFCRGHCENRGLDGLSKLIFDGCRFSISHQDGSTGTSSGADAAPQQGRQEQNAIREEETKMNDDKPCKRPDDDASTTSSLSSREAPSPQSFGAEIDTDFQDGGAAFDAPVSLADTYDTALHGSAGKSTTEVDDGTTAGIAEPPGSAEKMRPKSSLERGMAAAGSRRVLIACVAAGIAGVAIGAAVWGRRRR